MTTEKAARHGKRAVFWLFCGRYQLARRVLYNRHAAQVVRGERKAKAAAEHLNEELKADNERPLHIEGMDTMHWILLDYVNVVVHIFMPDERRFYDLESLWSDAPVTMVN
jgi:hypothetical protein